MKEFEVILRFILDRMAGELIRQGHRVTGDLIQSLYENSRVEKRGNVIVLVGKFESYGIQMDIGRLPGNYVPIQALIRWVERKGLETGRAEIVRAAWAINTAIFREGVPTRGSRAMGKKTGWVTDTLKDITSEIQQRLTSTQTVQIRNLIEEMVKRVNV